MYITIEDYLKWYDTEIGQQLFGRLAMETCRVLDKYTTGIDGVRKLREYFPTDEYDAEFVKYTAARMIDFLYQCHEAEQTAATGRGYTETDNGIRGKVISSVSAGNESISYATTATATATAVDEAIKDKSTKDKILFQTVRDGLIGVADCNGVNLLYMGVYPRLGVD